MQNIDKVLKIVKMMKQEIGKPLYFFPHEDAEQLKILEEELLILSKLINKKRGITKDELQCKIDEVNLKRKEENANI